MKAIIKLQLALLFFRNAAFNQVQRSHVLIYILIVTLLVGVGRYWDHPNAEVWQYLGIGSFVYIFALSGVLWLVGLPLKPKHWRYSNVLIFVGMTALPAILYAIPVEKFVSIETAGTINAQFLAIVAIWRVVMLIKFLRKPSGLYWLDVLVLTLLPITAIVFSLWVLNLEHAVFAIMSGLRVQPTPYDQAYSVVLFLTILSILSLPVLLLTYIVRIVLIQRKKYCVNVTA